MIICIIATIISLIAYVIGLIVEDYTPVAIGSAVLIVSIFILLALKDAIEGVKVNGKHYSKKQSYAYPQIVIKSSNGVNYDFNETITIKL